MENMHKQAKNVLSKYWINSSITLPSPKKSQELIPKVTITKGVKPHPHKLIWIKVLCFKNHSTCSWGCVADGGGCPSFSILFSIDHQIWFDLMNWLLRGTKTQRRNYRLVSTKLLVSRYTMIHNSELFFRKHRHQFFDILTDFLIIVQ